jgi:hypothetical protein
MADYLISDDQINRIRGRIVVIDEVWEKHPADQPLPAELVERVKDAANAIFDVLRDVRERKAG